MHTRAAGIYRHRDWHVNHVKLVNRFHPQVGKPDDFGMLDGLGHQVYPQGEG